MTDDPRLVDLTPDAVRDGLARHSIVLVDIREPHEYAAERIHGALNFPLSTFDPSALPTGGDRKLVLSCGTGRRTARAVAICAAAGVAVDTHLAGGITAWKAAGLPTISVDPATGRVREVR